MSTFLRTLSEVTLTMSAVIALLLLLEPLLGRRYTARWRYWVWMAVALRLLLPVNLSLPQAPIQLEVPAERVIYTYTPVAPQKAPSMEQGTAQATPQTGAPVGQGGLSPISPAPSGEQEAPLPQAARSLTLTQVLFGLWLLGVIALLGWHLISYGRFRRFVLRWGKAPAPAFQDQLEESKAKLGLSARVHLIVCPGLGSPMMTGFFRPILLLPAGEYDSRSLSYIFRHELIHYKRRDLWYKVLLLGANLMHWFNPLVYFMVRAAERDMELSCDDAVVKGLDPAARAEYGDVILAALRRSSPSLPERSAP
jgi:beta-lactamase regulating signal transducer with metallopeptidase domain